MKHKTYILLFTIVFALANVGLPFTLHICQMMQTVSFKSCAACSENVEKKSCCKENNSAAVNFTSIKDKCCETKLIVSPIDEKFLLVKTESVKEIFNFIDCVSFENFELCVDESSYHIFQNISPPPEKQNNIYIINSVFLI